MTNIDRWFQCESQNRVHIFTNELISGHNFTPLKAYIDDDNILHLNEECKWCGHIIRACKPYEDESPAQIKEIYGFRLDEPETTV